MQDAILAGETVRCEAGGHLTTAILGNYRPDHDAFDGWVLQPFNVMFTVQGGVSIPGFGTDTPWAALAGWHDAEFKEWDHSRANVTQNGLLFVRRGKGADYETEFLAYMTKRESLALPDQFQTPPAVDVPDVSSGQGTADASPVEQAPPPRQNDPSLGGHKHKHNQ